jgi:hypothetical protein
MSKAHNPVQDMYLRKVDGQGEPEAWAWPSRVWLIPARGCRM